MLTDELDWVVGVDTHLDEACQPLSDNRTRRRRNNSKDVLAADASTATRSAPRASSSSE
jgi:hypothetical protein